MKMVYYGALRAHLIDKGLDLVDCGVRSALSPRVHLPEFTPAASGEDYLFRGWPYPRKEIF